MSKEKRIYEIIIFIFIFIVLLFSSINISSDNAIATECSVRFDETAFSYVPTEELSNSLFANGIDGATIRVNVTSEQDALITSVKYTLVKIDTTSDSITSYDGDNIFLNSKAIDSDDVLDSGTILNENFIMYTSYSDSKYKYFDIVAKEWCIIVLDITYDDDSDEGTGLSYDSDTYSVINIDNSLPSAYYSTYTFDSGYYNFTVKISGNETLYSRSANSGIDSIRITKLVNGVSSTITTIESVNSYPYIYTLTVDNQRASYYATILDNVGNYNTCLIVSFNSSSYNVDFESAVNNAIDELSATDVYSSYLLSSLEEAYAQYYLLVQEWDETTDEDTLEELEADIEEQILVCTDIESDIAYARTLYNIGVKDYELNIINEEYLEGIELINVESAYGMLLYGETATFTIVLADYDINKVDKSAEIEVSELKNVTDVLDLTFSTVNNINEDEIIFDTPLQIKVPITDYGSVSCVVKIIDENGNEVIEKLDYTEYSGYITIDMPYADGVISIIIGDSTFNKLWYLLFLLVIPIGICIFFVVRNKKKKDENAKILAENEIKKDDFKKGIPKNKSKKGKRGKK
jgi:hypothetical protein